MLQEQRDSSEAQIFKKSLASYGSQIFIAAFAKSGPYLVCDISHPRSYILFLFILLGSCMYAYVEI
jgi:hypothetical protein